MNITIAVMELSGWWIAGIILSLLIMIAGGLIVMRTFGATTIEKPAVEDDGDGGDTKPPDPLPPRINDLGTDREIGG